MNKLINDYNFYLSNTEACPYIENNEERKIFTVIDSPIKLDDYESLIQFGFRRSNNILYNQICDGCDSCKSIRINSKTHTSTKSQKRILKKNYNLFQRTQKNKASLAQFNLFKKYLKFKHEESDMNKMNYTDYKKMLEAPGVNTKVYEYYHQDKLVACVISDLLNDSISMVYSFYSNDYLKNSIGKFLILDHFNLAKELRKKFVYLGYWVEGSEKMDYKSKFNSSEVLINNQWKNI